MAVKPDCQWNAFVTYATAGRHGGMYHLYEILARRKAHGDIDSLRLQRNEFRTYLMKNNIIRADSAYLPVFVRDMQLLALIVFFLMKVCRRGLGLSYIGIRSQEN